MWRTRYTDCIDHFVPVDLRTWFRAPASKPIFLDSCTIEDTGQSHKPPGSRGCWEGDDLVTAADMYSSISGPLSTHLFDLNVFG